MLLFSSDSNENTNKSGFNASVEHNRDSTAQQTASKRKQKSLSKENVIFLKSLGLVVKKRTK